jgi:hypothetical protein
MLVHPKLGFGLHAVVENHLIKFAKLLINLKIRKIIIIKNKKY